MTDALKNLRVEAARDLLWGPSVLADLMPLERRVEGLRQLGYHVEVSVDLPCCCACGVTLLRQAQFPRRICDTCRAAGDGDACCLGLALDRIRDAQGWRP